MPMSNISRKTDGFPEDREPDGTLTADLILFMGQSNMAGRGVSTREHPETAPECIPGAGYEFRAVSDPYRLHPLREPFGRNEDRAGGICDIAVKSGSLTTSFVNAYYQNGGHIPVIAVSASIGGSSIREWNEIYTKDAVERLRCAERFLGERSSPCRIRRRFAVWCQGETDGDNGTGREEYLQRLGRLIDTMQANGIEKLLVVRIGNCNIPGSEGRYTQMIRWQTEFCRTDPRAVLVSAGFAGMRGRGLMKDAFHYYQAAYNEVGEEAGRHAASYAETGREPVLYDPEYGTRYISAVSGTQA